MRKLVTLKNKKDLEILEGYLYYHGVETFSYEDPEDLNLWVVKDPDKERAKKLLGEFQKIYEKGDSSHPSYEKLLKNSLLGTSKKNLDGKLEEEREKKSRVIDARTIGSSRGRFHLLSVTGVLILFSGLLFLWANSEQHTGVVYRHFLISQFPAQIFFLFEVRQGEFWRLVTPIFIHGGFFHLIFNMMWLYQIGRFIEEKEGMIFYAGLVLSVAIISNFVFYLVVGPNVGGMSGVVYGLIGYVWAYNRVAPMSSYYMDEGLQRFFLIWYLICWGLTLAGAGFGVGVANTVHGMGAFMGILLGAFQAARREEGVVPLKRLFTKEGLMTLGVLFFLLGGSVVIDRVAMTLLR